MTQFEKGDKVAIVGREDDPECHGTVLQDTVIANEKVLVTFPASEAARKTGITSDRICIEKDRLVKRGGTRPGAGRPTNTERGLDPPGHVISARIAPAEAEWASEQVLRQRYPTMSAYIESLVAADRRAEQG